MQKDILLPKAINNMKIYLTDLEFFGFHGVYEAEKKIGNSFHLDIVIDFTPPVKRVEQLDQTIDYVQVYNKVKSIMAFPTPLLETIVDKIACQILSDHSMADKVFVKITKQKLFIPYFEGATSVSIEKARK
jgi:dihydroneopterin aldolase